MDQIERGLLRVALSVLEQLDLDDVLDRVLVEARTLTGARYAALGVLDDSALSLSRFITSGLDDRAAEQIGPLPTGRGVLGELIRDPRPLRLADVGRHPYSYGFPAGHPPMRSFLGVPVLVGGRPYGNLYLTDKKGADTFTEEDEQTVVALADLAGVAIDHASRFGQSEAQRQELERTVAALDATLQIARAVGATTSLAEVLELVAKRGRALVSARALVIELRRDAELELVAGAGELPDDLVGRRLPLADTVASAALRSGCTQRLTDTLNRARFEQHGIGHLGVEAKDGLVVPLVFRDQAYGVLVVVDRLGGAAFDAEDVRLLEAFAASAATAVATAQSVADERRRQRLAAAEAERTHWARELHDETLQALGHLRLVLSGARRSDDLETVRAALDAGLAQLEHDTANLRALIAELRPAALDQLGLGPALHALVDRARTTGLDVDADIDLADEAGSASDRLVADLETAIYRIAQEALTNAVKHGGARRAVLEVSEQGQRIAVIVRDDGRGFDPVAATEGFGLLGMRERVELLGGELKVASAPGAGTTVTAGFEAVHRSASDARRPGPAKIRSAY